MYNGCPVYSSIFCCPKFLEHGENCIRKRRIYPTQWKSRWSKGRLPGIDQELQESHFINNAPEKNLGAVEITFVATTDVSLPGNTRWTKHLWNVTRCKGVQKRGFLLTYHAIRSAGKCASYSRDVQQRNRNTSWHVDRSRNSSQGTGLVFCFQAIDTNWLVLDCSGFGPNRSLSIAHRARRMPACQVSKLPLAWLYMTSNKHLTAHNLSEVHTSGYLISGIHCRDLNLA